MDINDLYSSQITAGTVTASQASFGTPGVLAPFAAGTKGFAASGMGSRAKVYTSTAAMLADGWAATDSAYLAVKAAFDQAPHARKVLVGRIDSGDANVAASAAAIRAEIDDWWAFEVVGYRSLKFTLSADLVTSNVLNSTINGAAIGAVTYTSSHATTMAAWLTAIRVVFPTATGVVSGRTLTVTVPGLDLNAGTAVVTLGASQATNVTTYILDKTVMQAWIDWVAGTVKMLLISDSDEATYAAPTGSLSTCCLAEYIRLKNNGRAAVIFHQTPGEYICMASAGLELYYAPGLRTWAFKSYTNVSADVLTFTQDQAIRAKGANTYTQVYGAAGGTGVIMNYAGTTGKLNTYIDDVRGTDWLNSMIQTDQLNLDLANPKIPYTDSGIQLRVATLRASLKKAQRNTVLNPEVNPTIIFPLAAECSAEDKAARILRNVSWSASYAGAIQNMDIVGTISFSLN